MIHSTLREQTRKVTSLSVVAFERLTDGDPTRLGTEVSRWCGRRMSTPTKDGARNVERFKGRQTLLHQCNHQQKIFPVMAPQSEAPEVDAARKGQQGTDDGSEAPGTQ